MNIDMETQIPRQNNTSNKKAIPRQIKPAVQIPPPMALFNVNRTSIHQAPWIPCFKGQDQDSRTPRYLCTLSFGNAKKILKRPSTTCPGTRRRKEKKKNRIMISRQKPMPSPIPQGDACFVAGTLRRKTADREVQARILSSSKSLFSFVLFFAAMDDWMVPGVPYQLQVLARMAGRISWRIGG